MIFEAVESNRYMCNILSAKKLPLSDFIQENEITAYVGIVNVKRNTAERWIAKIVLTQKL